MVEGSCKLSRKPPIGEKSEICANLRDTFIFDLMRLDLYGCVPQLAIVRGS